MRASERILLRTQLDGASRALAAAVASYLVSPATEKAAAMHVALQSYTEARQALDG